MRKWVHFPAGQQVLNLGQGTWMMGEQPTRWQAECEALQTGIAAGLTTIDTAEIYGDGKSEKLVAAAIRSFPRDDLFLISKVHPHHAGERHMFAACEATLKRLNVASLDLYLLHWRGAIPLQETIDCFEELKKQGKIKNWGVSNFDLADMQELLSKRNGRQCQTDQVLYHLASRGIDVELRTYLAQRQIPIMAYCPLAAQQADLKRKLLTNPVVQQIAARYQITVMQVLLCYVLQQDHLLAIPKAGQVKHVKENVACLDIELAAEDLALLNTAFPAPTYPVPLDIV